MSDVNSVNGSENDKTKASIVKDKMDLCSLVFSYEAVFHGIANFGTKQFNEETASDSLARWYVTRKYMKTHSYEVSPVHVFRTNPSKSHFQIEKYKQKSQPNSILNIKFKNIKFISRFDMSGDERGTFTCIIIGSPKAVDYVYAVVLSFKDSEVKQKLIRNLIFCNNSLKDTKIYNELVVKNKYFTYKSFEAEIRKEIYEIENGERSIVPREEKMFKLRQNVHKVIEIVIAPQISYDLVIEKCSEVSYSVSNEKGQFDEFKFERINDKDDETKVSYRITVDISPNSPSSVIFKILKEEIASFMVYVDMLVDELIDTVRFSFRFDCIMFPEKEKFWLKGKQNQWQNVFLIIKRDNELLSNQKNLSFTHLEEFDKSVKATRENIDKPLNLKAPLDTSLINQLNQSIDLNESDEQDLVLSGTFHFQMDIPSETLLEWENLIAEWKNTRIQPPRVEKLLKIGGIPKEKKKAVWLMLAGVYDEESENHKLFHDLVNKDSDYDKIITYDMTRTFTCHEYFEQKGGEGQTCLYRVCKAYSNYDKELGYCQGMSFIVANLLLHMDEVNAFVLLVKIMFHLGQRELFLKSFDSLHAHLYVFKRMLATQVPELGLHLRELKIEPHMYIPQWFLTIFTAKFPLGFVDLSFDMFFMEGKRSILLISLALLKICASDIINLSFEHTLKYISTILPKRFSNQVNTNELFGTMNHMLFSDSNVDELLLEYERYKTRLSSTHDPLELIKIENKILLETQIRMDSEIGALKLKLYSLADKHTHESEQFTKLKLNMNEKIKKMEIEQHNLNDTIEALQNQEKMLKNEVRRSNNEMEESSKQKDTIIAEYKKTCSRIEAREEKMQNKLKDLLHKYTKAFDECEKCAALFNNFKCELQSDECLNILPSSLISSSSSGDLSSAKKIEAIEMELARIKDQLYTSQARNEELERKLNEPKKVSFKSWLNM